MSKHSEYPVFDLLSHPDYAGGRVNAVPSLFSIMRRLKNLQRQADREALQQKIEERNDQDEKIRAELLAPGRIEAFNEQGRIIGHYSVSGPDSKREVMVYISAELAERITADPSKFYLKHESNRVHAVYSQKNETAEPKLEETGRHLSWSLEQFDQIKLRLKNSNKSE